MRDKEDGKFRGIVSSLLSPLWSNSGRTLLIVVASGDGECVKIGWTILDPKARTSAFYDGSCLVAGVVLGSEFGLLVSSEFGPVRTLLSSNALISFSYKTKR